MIVPTESQTYPAVHNIGFSMPKDGQNMGKGAFGSPFDLQSYLVNIFPPDTDPHFYKSDQQDMVDSEFLEKDQYRRHHTFLRGN